MSDQYHYSDTRDWESGKEHLIRLAVLFTLPIGILGFRYLMRAGPILFVLVFIILVFIVYQILDAILPPVIYKRYYVPRYDAQQIVKGVLAEKQIPFEEKNGRFRVSNLKITIKSKLGANLQSNGCVIQITPFIEEEEPFILSLCTKIDNAFAPRGLEA